MKDHGIIKALRYQIYPKKHELLGERPEPSVFKLDYEYFMFLLESG